MKSSLPLVLGIAISLFAGAPLSAATRHSTVSAAHRHSTAPASPPPATAPAATMAGPPMIQARTWVLVDFGSDQLLAEQGADQRIEPASLTKLMCAYAVFSALREGRVKMDETVLISEHAWHAEGSRTFVQVGTRVPVDVLIKGMIIQSGNDATIALAERIAGSEGAFVQMMNGYAQRLGMRGTHFEDSSGLPSPNHYSTARDLATLSRALIRDFPQYYGTFAVREFTWNNIRQENRNGLLERDPSVDGIKTGHTDTAGYCLISSALRSGMRLISVVLGSPSVQARESGSAALLNYGFNFFETVPVKKAGEMVLKPRVYKGSAQYIGLAPLTAVQVTVPRGQAGTVAVRTDVHQPLIAPLAVNSALGQMQITVAGKVVANVPLYPLTAVPQGGIWRRLIDTIILWF